MNYATGDEATVSQYQALCAKALGCPRMPMAVGEGIHDLAAGVATAYDNVVKHPSAELWRHLALDPADSRVVMARLTAGEQSDLIATWASATPLDPSWG